MKKCRIPIDVVTFLGSQVSNLRGSGGSFGGPSGPQMGDDLWRGGVLGPVGAMLGSLGVILGPFGAILEPLGAILGPSWGRLGAILGPSAAILGPSWSLLGPSWPSPLPAASPSPPEPRIQLFFIELDGFYADAPRRL